MKCLKNLPGKPKMKNPLGIWFPVLLLVVVGLFASCESSTSNRPAGGGTGVVAPASPPLWNTLVNERVPKSIAEEEVLRYNKFADDISTRLGIDSKRIPRYFLLNVSDFLQVMGVPDSLFSKLPHKYGHARIYISLDLHKQLHLLLTPVEDARIYSECEADTTRWGSDDILTGEITPPCPALVSSRYGGQQKVDQIFGTHSKKKLEAYGQLLLDLSGLCPPCDPGLLTSKRFFGNQQ
jgi:hypothetical protein